MRTSIYRLLVIAVMLFPATVLHAQIYKWKDARGTVHFSQAPPEQDIHYSEVKTDVNSAADSGKPSTVAASTLASKPDAKPAVPAQPVADTPENRIALCKTLNKSLEALNGSGPVVMQQDGKLTALDTAQRKQQQMSARARQKQYCQAS